MCEFNRQFFPLRPVNLSYDPTELPGFQNHAAESISTCLQRFANGDTSVYHPSEDALDREVYFEDQFAALDRAQSYQDESNNSAFSDSGNGAGRGHGSVADNPGNAEIDSGSPAGRNPEVSDGGQQSNNPPSN